MKKDQDKLSDSLTDDEVCAICFKPFEKCSCTGIDYEEFDEVVRTESNDGMIDLLLDEDKESPFEKDEDY